MSDEFKLGDFVLLVYDKKRRWIKRISEEPFHCNYGVLHLVELIGQAPGISIQTNTGKWIRALHPTLIDWFGFFEHGSQIIYPKDAAMISLLLDIKPGDTIFEAGTGSGALTSLLSRSVGNTGCVFTFEKRISAYKTAIKNHSRLGTKNVVFTHQDVCENGFSTDGDTILADGLILDMGDPWNTIPFITQILKIGRKLVVFIPTFQQLERMYQRLHDFGFKDINAIELIKRSIQMKPNAIRPSTRMIGHTGFLLHATYLPKTAGKRESSEVKKDSSPPQED